jgi:hypothetical protein
MLAVANVVPQRPEKDRKPVSSSLAKTKGLWARQNSRAPKECSNNTGGLLKTTT